MKWLSFFLLLLACSPEPHSSAVHGSERMAPSTVLGTQTLKPGLPFRQVGLFIDGPAEGLAYRVRTAQGVLSEVRSVPLTWSEGRAHVGRILLDEVAVELTLETSQPIGIHPEFWRELQADPQRPLTRDLPLDLEVLRQGLAPPELAIRREVWGARNPGLICAEPMDIYRISVHHTAAPDSDGGDPAVRMRQIQAYHIDNNGWCDIGYHFVVSQSGLIYEARRDERAPAAHVGGQNSGNVGISFIGNYEVAEVPAAQFAAAARIMSWVRMTHGVPADRNVIRGHQEWPGQQTACPGANLLRRLDELIALSGGAVEPPPPPPPEDAVVNYRSLWLDPQNPHTQGTSSDVPDAYAGRRVRVAFQIHNGGGSPLRGVRLGYVLGADFLPVDYVIQTDWPAKDQQTWVTNDADTAPENPPKDRLGAQGDLTMFAFGVGETKRVVVTLELGAYRGTFRPEAQGYVRHIDGVYDQADFDVEPGTNTTGQRLAEAVGLDVLSPTEWAFPSAEAADLEGFSACGPRAVNDDGALVIPADGCAHSPSWTQIDADRWDSLVVDLRRAPPRSRLAVWWKGGEDAFSAARSLTFEITGPGTWVLPLDFSETWAGVATGLRLTLDGALAIDGIRPQSRARQEAGSVTAPFAEGSLATVLTDEDPPPVPDGGVDEDDAGAPPSADAASLGPDAGPGGGPADAAGQTSTDGVDGGCSQARGTSGGAWVFVGLSAVLAVRRRHPWRNTA